MYQCWKVFGKNRERIETERVEQEIVETPVTRENENQVTIENMVP